MTVICRFSCHWGGKTTDAYFDEGNRIRILDGFLKDYEGSIIRVDRRHRSVQVKLMFQGKTLTTWLGYEDISNPSG